MNRKSSFFDMQFITSSISTTMVLLLLGLVVYFVIAADKLSTYARENIAFFILIDDNTKETDILQFQKQLNQKPYVKQTTYISKNQALKEQTEAMGTDPTEFLGYNPFSASIEVKLNAIYTNTDSLRWIKNDIQSHKQVVELSYPQELLNAVNQNIQKLTIILLGLAILFYEYSRFYKDNLFEKYADEIMDSLIFIPGKVSIDIYSGISGICWGIVYLFKRGFLGGNINDILYELDRKLMIYSNYTEEDKKSVLSYIKYRKDYSESLYEKSLLCSEYKAEILSIGNKYCGILYNEKDIINIIWENWMYKNG